MDWDDEFGNGYDEMDEFKLGIS